MFRMETYPVYEIRLQFQIITNGIDILSGMAAALLKPHYAALALVLADEKALSHFAELLDKKWPKNFCPQQFQQCRS